MGDLATAVAAVESRAGVGSAGHRRSLVPRSDRSPLVAPFATVWTTPHQFAAHTLQECPLALCSFAQTVEGLPYRMRRMDNSKRGPGFWAEAGVVYDDERAGSLQCWRARLPGCADIAGHGRTKPLALADLKSAHARARFDERMR